ncbi:MAG: sulfite exporter TauE/SafE family protein [Cytophagaceae bacterium]
MNFELHVLLFFILFAVAFLYASVGHGGASGYLAVLSLFGISIVSLKYSALVLNIFVSALAFFQYYRAGHFRWKLFYPFAMFSVPFAFMGGALSVDPFWYKKLLGLCLVLAVGRIIFSFIRQEEPADFSPVPVKLAALFGSSIGFLSGLIGIGGGIILSPVILLMKWGSTKQTSAASALFIFVNSVAALIGLKFQKVDISTYNIFPWLIAALAGGMMGSYWGSKKASAVVLKNVLAAVLLFAAVKLILV